MRKSQVKEIVNCFEYLGDPFNPLDYVRTKHKFDMNVKTGNVSYPKGDSVSDFFIMKGNWILERSKKLKGDLDDFEEIRITVFNKKEELILNYKGETFRKEVNHERIRKDIKELIREIKKMKPFDVRDVLRENKK